MKYKPILFLFGAGASLGSGGTTPTPPSGSELFGRLCQAYPETWGNISGQLANDFSTSNFETGMLSLYQSPGPHNVNKLLLDLGIYFSKVRITNLKINLYYQIVIRYLPHIMNGTIILSTLNYDCLIEQALLASGITSITYWGNGTGVRLLKLHGSCNFIPQGITVNSGQLIVGPHEINATQPPRILHPDKAWEELSKGGILPAMSMYAKGKNNIACEQYIIMIQKQFQEIVQSAKVVLPIGIRPEADDHHIWDCIAMSETELFFVGNLQLCQGWIDKNHPARAKVLGQRFEKSFSEICNAVDKFI
jgi:hypothetical protein